MIIFSKALADKATVWNSMRTARNGCDRLPNDLIRFSAESRPVVMWNLTRRCNLACEHCYIDAKSSEQSQPEMTMDDGVRLIDELAQMGIPVLIFTGGEPLMSRHFFAYAFHAKDAGLKTAVSTNGTLITPAAARLMKEAGVGYVGVSLDASIPSRHDGFRGVEGAHSLALEGLKNAKDAGLRTGLRVTLTRDNWHDVPSLLGLCLERGIPRFCLYHLVPTGRGAFISSRDVTPLQRRSVLKFLAEAAVELKEREIEILTTDSPMDGAYIVELLEGDPRQEAVRELLLSSGGCSAGIKVANIDPAGDVHPCHFMPHLVLGNLRERSFKSIWIDDPVKDLVELRQIRTKLKGICGECKHNDLCGGCRQKAYFFKGDLHEADPTCILQGEE
jgi:radical SAM protein with 4Fe4S-binding SPASM domain